MKQSRPTFIGITGGIGAGKSEIIQYIARHYQCEIYLADEVAHLVKEPGTACYDALLQLLGQDIVSPDGRIDRRKMAERMFGDEELLGKVNDIIHPAVRDFLLERLEKARAKAEKELFIVEAALLIECGYGRLVDEMWYVYADEKIRRERLKTVRGYSDEKIDSIMGSQLSEQKFRENCDFVIDNSGSLEDSYRIIDKKLEAYSWQE